jgi:hypothetical protein
MQAGEGKAACKSDKIAANPTQGPSAEVTPCLKVNEREQAQAKKIKQARKKGAGRFLWPGATCAGFVLGGHPNQCCR